MAALQDYCRLLAHFSIDPAELPEIYREIQKITRKLFRDYKELTEKQIEDSCVTLGKDVIAWLELYDAQIQTFNEENQRISVFSAMKKLHFAAIGRNSQLQPHFSRCAPSLTTFFSAFLQSLYLSLTRLLQNKSLNWRRISEILDQLLPNLDSKEVISAVSGRFNELTESDLGHFQVISVLFQLYYTRLAPKSVNFLISGINSLLISAENRVKAVFMTFALMEDYEKFPNFELENLPLNTIFTLILNFHPNLQFYILETLTKTEIYEKIQHLYEFRSLIFPLFTLEMMEKTVKSSNWRIISCLLASKYHVSDLKVTEIELKSLVSAAFCQFLPISILPFFSMFYTEHIPLYRLYLGKISSSQRVQFLIISFLEGRNWHKAAAFVSEITVDTEEVLGKVYRARQAKFGLMLVCSGSRWQRVPKTVVREIVSEYIGT